MPNPDGRRPKRKSLRAIKLSERELENLQELVADWPVALANSLSKEVDLNSGSSYTALGVKLNRRQFRLFEIITAEIRKIYPTQYAVIESQSESKYLFSQSHSSKLDVLVALTGSSRKFLIRQIIKGAIAPGLLKSGDLLDKDRLEIDAYSSEHISKLYRETYDCQTAASRAGCSVGAMQGLLAMKLLPSTSIFIEPVPMKSRRIYPEDLQNFVFELFSRACCLDEIPPTHIKFSDWVTKHSHGRNSRHLRWRDLFDALRNGKLELHKSSDAHTLLDQLFIDAEAVAIICDKRRGSRKCSS
jgi:hypothetical protein